MYGRLGAYTTVDICRGCTFEEAILMIPNIHYEQLFLGIIQAIH